VNCSRPVGLPTGRLQRRATYLYRGEPMRFISRLCALAVIVCLAGCKSHPYDVVAVSGVVTINGKPVKDVRVAFQPTDTTKLNPGPGSIGVTDQDGRYTLKAIGLGTNGAVV